MSVVIGVLRELYGLFVEDAGFASAILVWTALFALGAHYVGGVTLGPVLFAGFAAILLVAVRRASAR
jgi:hypothetical protein